LRPQQRQYIATHNLFFVCGTATGPMALAYGGLLGRPVADRILGLQQSKSSLSEGRVVFLKPSHRRL
jgi:hypothetical protein